NEGDMIFAAENMTVEQMALTIRHGSGIVCLCITEDRRKQLELPMMVENNTSAFGTGFTVTIEAAHGVTTGVSAADRLTTVRAAHTEATIDLVTLAGFKPAGVLCELTNDDGTMARAPECITFARLHNMPVVTIEDLIEYRQAHERKAS
ncbi:MAG: 3,4-dihydroxy-2-butanone-4-phosphate synthase, partial [Enterobacter sp.]|nr:3,4-dihydroxy-2-butanone-4-phosphate synthase [Enterobacter sp.]